jgi:hypothetical protein
MINCDILQPQIQIIFDFFYKKDESSNVCLYSFTFNKTAPSSYPVHMDSFLPGDKDNQDMKLTTHL